MKLSENPDFEVVTSGYADFEEDGAYYRRKVGMLAQAKENLPLARALGGLQLAQVVDRGDSDPRHFTRAEVEAFWGADDDRSDKDG